MVEAVQAIIDGKDRRLIGESGLFLETVKTSFRAYSLKGVI